MERFDNIPKKMKAVVQYAPYDNRYEEVDVPAIAEDEVLLKVLACGICAGDVKAYHGGIRIWGTTEENRYIEAPVIGGHEFFGEIVAVGDDVSDYQIGERICVEQIAPCNKCNFCRQGKYWMCEESAVYGFKQHINGGFAEYVKLHRNSILHKVPDSFTLEQAALIEPIACGMHAVELAQIKHDDVVVVSGLGAIGLSILNMVKLNLPSAIIGLDVKDFRKQKGLAFGADITLNPLVDDVEKEIEKLVGKKGCTVYIEASGSPASVTQGLNLLRNHGRYVQMGVFAQEVKADWNVIGDGKELSIIGSHLSALTFPAVIEGIKTGLIQTDGLITHSFKLEEWEKGFETAQNNPEALKVMLVPQSADASNS